GQDIGGDAVALGREPVAATPHAGLDLVEDEEYAVLVAEPAQSGQKQGRGRGVPTLAQDRFDDDRRNLLGGDGMAQEFLQKPEASQGAAFGIAAELADRKST